jgi:hypothetical protein
MKRLATWHGHKSLQLIDETLANGAPLLLRVIEGLKLRRYGHAQLSSQIRRLCPTCGKVAPHKSRRTAEA